ncbi:MAG: GT2 family glycosyltransferase, partial [Parasphingorhabdus sp.]
GLERSNSNYSLLLNPDAALYEDTLTELIDYMERHPRVGIVGPGLFDENGDLQRDCSATGIAPGFGQAMFEYTRLGRYFPNHRLIKQYFQTQEQRKKQQSVAMVQGACFLFRRTLFEQIGQFDENYFLYFEETDYCQRALGQDWQVHYLGNQSCQHSGAHSMPQGQQASWYFIRSLYRYHSKHTGRFKTIMLWLILMPYHLLKVIRMSCFQVAQPNNIVLRKDLQVARERFLCHFWFLTQAPHLR